MKKSHFIFASFGSVSLHGMLAVFLFMGATVLPKPNVQEAIITHIHLLDEPLATPLPQVLEPQMMPQSPEPIVEKKPEKKVKKEVLKPAPSPKKAEEPVMLPSHESFATSDVMEKSETAPSQEEAKRTLASTHHSEDLLLVYLAKVRHKVQESLRYPSMAKKMGLEGEAIVRFLIHPNGMVDASSVVIAKSSGKAILDRNAINAVLDALPFELPPQEEMEIVIPVVFKIQS